MPKSEEVSKNSEDNIKRHRRTQRNNNDHNSIKNMYV